MEIMEIMTSPHPNICSLLVYESYLIDFYAWCCRGESHENMVVYLTSNEIYEDIVLHDSKRYHFEARWFSVENDKAWQNLHLS